MLVTVIRSRVKKQWDLVVTALKMKMIHPCVTGVDDECDVETAGGTCSVACSANLTFFMSGSASEAGRDIFFVRHLWLLHRGQHLKTWL